MALITEAGWPQCTRAECDNPLVPGTRAVRPELRRGDVATILVAWAAWFHANVRSIEPADGHRNWWGWSATNDVWNSNHLSGTALDLCADELPHRFYRMPAYQVDIVREGLKLFEGNVFWGRDWGPGQQDEMHFQVGYNTYNSAKFADFAERLRRGHLGIYSPPDPDAFPLPVGYYYGPLTGPAESVSGEYAGELQSWRDGLGRWQATLGLPVTRRWSDGATPQAAYTLQREKGWPPNPSFGYGGVYKAEWEAVIKQGWRLPPGWQASSVLADDLVGITRWGDYSQYQSAHIDDSYPYRVVAFRASIADPTAPQGGGIDAKFIENIRRAKDMIARGRLDKVIAYHFWVPGRDNFGTFRAAIEATGGVFPELAFMLDVEDGGAKWGITGDQTEGVIDFITRGREYFGNQHAASLYINFVVNAALLPGINRPELADVKLIVPRYHSPTAPPYVPPNVVGYFGHQYTDRENTPPFGPSDMNQALMPLGDFLAAWGVNGGGQPPVEPPPVEEPPEPPGAPVLPDDMRDQAALAILAQFG